MTALGLESRLVQNPALGAVVLWRFVHSYYHAHSLRAAAPFCLAALVLPMVWHAETAENIASTREASGLRAFADKQLAAALTSLEQARNEAQRKQLYLERIVQASLPDVAVEPRRLRNVLATFALGLVAWGVIGMLLAGVREHQQ